MFSCKQNSLHKSNILLLSNNIPLIISKSPFQTIGAPHDVSSVVALGEALGELYITQLYIALLKIYEENHLKVINVTVCFRGGSRVMCVLDTLETEVPLSVFEEDLGWAGLGHALLLSSVSLSPGSFSIKTYTHK